MYPYYAHPDFLHQEFIHKDDEERFREALQVMRAERAEQQQKQMVSEPCVSSGTEISIGLCHSPTCRRKPQRSV